MLRLLPLALCALWMLFYPAAVLDAASEACALFAKSVLPALYPYMILMQLLVSRLPTNVPGAVHVLLGWGAGSPCGARLCAALAESGTEAPALRRLAVTCATMSPMFLCGTLGAWLGSSRGGLCAAFAVLFGGWVTGRLVPAGTQVKPAASPQVPLTLGQAVEKSSITLLTVCGCIVLGRVLCALAFATAPGLPQGARLLCLCLTEATSALRELCGLSLPLPLRVALASAEAGFGGGAILLQNRAVYPTGMMTLPKQAAWQVLHGALSGVIGWAAALLLL